MSIVSKPFSALTLTVALASSAAACTGSVDKPGGGGTNPGATGGASNGSGGNGAMSGSGNVGVGGDGVPVMRLDCSAASVPKHPLRRLTRFEYNNTVRDLAGVTDNPANNFPPEDVGNGFGTDANTQTVQSVGVEKYNTTAKSIAASLTASDKIAGLAPCASAPASADEASCARTVVENFVPRAFRRPPTATELSRLRAVYEGAFAILGFSGGIQTALEAILQSPQFLYREELGPGEPEVTPGKSVQLTDYEVATQLSFMLTGTSPDDTLWNAVVAGNFRTTDDHRREAERLLATEGARNTLRAFLHQWLATDRLASVTKDLTVYPSFGPALAASMTSELDRFYDAILWQGHGSLRELFTSSQSYADAALGQLYGAAVSGNELQPVTLDPTIRAGVLTRAGFLSVHSAIDSSGPITRGVFVLQSLLCAPPPPPPGDVPPAAAVGDPLVKDLTTRQRFERHVSTPFCAGCHRMIDGVGFGFEQFDGVGAYRTTEKGQPIDSSGALVGTNGIDGPYVGVAELAHKIADSSQLRDCFVKQAYRFGMGQVEPPDSAAALEALAGDFSADAALVTVLLRLVQSPLFTTRSVEPPNDGGKP